MIKVTAAGPGDVLAFYQMLLLPRHPSKIHYRVEDAGGGFQIPG